MVAMRVFLGLLGMSAILSADWFGRLGERRWRETLGRDIKGVRLGYHVGLTLGGLALITFAIVWPLGR